MTNGIQKLFAEYEKAFAALDIEKSAGFFADAFISAGPRGAIAQSKPEFLKMAHKASEFTKALARHLRKSFRLPKPPSAMSIRWSKSTGE